VRGTGGNGRLSTFIAPYRTKYSFPLPIRGSDGGHNCNQLLAGPEEVIAHSIEQAALRLRGKMPHKVG